MGQFSILSIFVSESYLFYFLTAHIIASQIPKQRRRHIFSTNALGGGSERRTKAFSNHLLYVKSARFIQQVYTYDITQTLGLENKLPILGCHIFIARTTSVNRFVSRVDVPKFSTSFDISTQPHKYIHVWCGRAEVCTNCLFSVGCLNWLIICTK